MLVHGLELRRTGKTLRSAMPETPEASEKKAA
jgi:hypothetical protein